MAISSSNGSSPRYNWPTHPQTITLNTPHSQTVVNFSFVPGGGFDATWQYGSLHSGFLRWLATTFPSLEHVDFIPKCDSPNKHSHDSLEDASVDPHHVATSFREICPKIKRVGFPGMLIHVGVDQEVVEVLDSVPAEGKAQDS